MTSTPPLTQSIGQAENALRAILERLLGETKTTFPQWAALSLIARGGPIVRRDPLARQVSGALQLDQSQVLAMLGDLARLGLAAAPPDDPASVALTADGQALVHRLRQRIEGVTARLYGDLPADDLAATRRVLAQIAERATAELAVLQ